MKTYAEKCVVCGRGAGGLHAIVGHVAGTTPPRKASELLYAPICSPDCAEKARAAQEQGG